MVAGPGQIEFLSGVQRIGRLETVGLDDEDAGHLGAMGYPYYWFGLHGIEHTPGHKTDLEAMADGFISVTPLHLDLTHDASLAVLAQRFAQ